VHDTPPSRARVTSALQPIPPKVSTTVPSKFLRAAAPKRAPSLVDLMPALVVFFLFPPAQAFWDARTCVIATAGCIPKPC
jgi:hypothetical protein